MAMFWGSLSLVIVTQASRCCLREGKGGLTLCFWGLQWLPEA